MGRGAFRVSPWAVWTRMPGGAAADGDEAHIAWAQEALQLLRPYTLLRYRALPS